MSYILIENSLILLLTGNVDDDSSLIWAFLFAVGFDLANKTRSKWTNGASKMRKAK